MRGPHSTGLVGGLHEFYPGCCCPGETGGCSETSASSALLPLLGTLPLLLAQRLLLPLQMLPQLFCLAQVALCSLLISLQQLGLVQAPEPPHLLLVLRNEFLDLGLQTCRDGGCTGDKAAGPLRPATASKHSKPGILWREEPGTAPQKPSSRSVLNTVAFPACGMHGSPAPWCVSQWHGA